MIFKVAESIGLHLAAWDDELLLHKVWFLDASIVQQSLAENHGLASLNVSEAI